MTDTTTTPATPFLKGVFSLYETPSGGYHLAYRPDGADEDQHIDVPGWIISMARQAEGGGLNPMAMLKGLRGAK